MEDVMRFKIASEVISRIIQYFGYASLFPRECYEFYARITGRTLRIDENDSRLRFAIPFSKCRRSCRMSHIQYQSQLWGLTVN